MSEEIEKLRRVEAAARVVYEARYRGTSGRKRSEQWAELRAALDAISGVTGDRLASLTDGLRDLGDDDAQAAADYREAKAWELFVAVVGDGREGEIGAEHAEYAFRDADLFLAEAKRQREKAKEDQDARG